MQLKTWDKKYMYDMDSIVKSGIDLKNILSTPITETPCRNSRCPHYTTECRYNLQNQCLKNYIDRGGNK
jgi:hypothetical protein